jgi:hypothetical protein
MGKAPWLPAGNPLAFSCADPTDWADSAVRKLGAIEGRRSTTRIVPVVGRREGEVVAEGVGKPPMKRIEILRVTTRVVINSLIYAE